MRSFNWLPAVLAQEVFFRWIGWFDYLPARPGEELAYRGALRDRSREVFHIVLPEFLKYLVYGSVADLVLFK